MKAWSPWWYFVLPLKCQDKWNTSIYKSELRYKLNDIQSVVCIILACIAYMPHTGCWHHIAHHTVHITEGTTLVSSDHIVHHTVHITEGTTLVSSDHIAHHTVHITEGTTLVSSDHIAHHTVHITEGTTLVSSDHIAHHTVHITEGTTLVSSRNQMTGEE